MLWFPHVNPVCSHFSAGAKLSRLSREVPSMTGCLSTVRLGVRPLTPILVAVVVLLSLVRCRPAVQADESGALTARLAPVRARVRSGAPGDQKRARLRDRSLEAPEVPR